jgi:catechol 2,3-dioxygenase-like lactoylglutathione lyase family enzyme
MTLGIVTIDHVQIAVPRALETQCLAFYRDILGLAELPKPPELRARGGGWFQAGASQMHIGIDAGASPASKRHICFLVADLAAAKAALTARGVEIEDESVAQGLARFFLHDPAGNRIEIGMR